MPKGSAVVEWVGESDLKPTAVAALVFHYLSMNLTNGFAVPLGGSSECPVWRLFHRRHKDMADILAVFISLDTFLPLFLNDEISFNGYVVYSIFL